MANPIFTMGDDVVDLRKLDLDFLEGQGVITNDALAGNDTVWLSETQNLGELFKAGDGRDTVYGSISRGDYISGGASTDWLYGYGGADQLFGGDDTDRLYGGADNDLLNGQLDRDYLWGDEGDDDLYGGDGNDLLYGGVGRDDLYGGDGADQLYGEAGDDYLSGNTGNDQLRGGAGNDWLISGKGLDVLIFYGEDMDGSRDEIRDYVLGEDRVRLVGVEDASGTLIDGFDDLDTNRDGVLNGADANVRVANSGATGGSFVRLELTLEHGSVIQFNVVKELTAADFEFTLV